MLLLLHRHALAAEPDPLIYPDDSLRPLLPKGRRIQRRMSRRLQAAGVAPSKVYSSPWTRAWQTARIIGKESGLGKTDRIRCAALAAPPDLEALAAALWGAGPGDRVAMVGHEPWMSGLASLLLTGSITGLAVDFPKSGIMAIELEELEPGSGTLRYFLRP
jgi:phosphohistidine phosphatase